MARPENPLIVQHSSPATYGIVAVNVIVFVLLELAGGSGNIGVLLRWGAKFTPLIRSGEWWRMITSMFLHSGVIHLAVNSYSLYNLGGLAERLFGTVRFIPIYLVSGLWGSIASTLFSDLMGVGIGASGAIFGVAGCLFYFGAAYPRHFSVLAGKRFIAVVAANLVIGFAAGGIDAYAHVGGLIGGFAASAALGFPYETPEPYRGVLEIAFGLATAVGLFFAISG